MTGDWEETEEDISRKWNADEAGCKNDLVIKEYPTDQKTRTKEKRDPVQRENSGRGEIIIFRFHVEFQGSRGLVTSGHCQTSTRTECCPTQPHTQKLHQQGLWLCFQDTMHRCVQVCPNVKGS